MEDPGDDRPSWLTGPCPSWCTRAHHEDDHPEDRRHTDDGRVVPAVLGRVVPADLHTEPYAADLVVQRYRELGSPLTWVRVSETEDDRSALVVSAESLTGLVRELALQADPG